jgi:hypothetical protein
MDTPADFPPLTEFWLPLEFVASHTAVHLQTVRKDARSGLLKAERRAGVKGLTARADRVNLYIRRKFGASRRPVTVEQLSRLSEALVEHA